MIERRPWAVPSSGHSARLKEMAATPGPGTPGASTVVRAPILLAGLCAGADASPDMSGIHIAAPPEDGRSVLGLHRSSVTFTGRECSPGCGVCVHDAAGAPGLGSGHFGTVQGERTARGGARRSIQLRPALQGPARAQ